MKKIIIAGLVISSINAETINTIKTKLNYAQRKIYKLEQENKKLKNLVIDLTEENIKIKKNKIEITCKNIGKKISQRMESSYINGKFSSKMIKCFEKSKGKIYSDLIKTK